MKLYIFLIVVVILKENWYFVLINYIIIIKDFVEQNLSY